MPDGSLSLMIAELRSLQETRFLFENEYFLFQLLAGRC